MVTWSIQSADGTVKTFAEAGIVSASRTLFNQDADNVKLSVGFGDMLSDAYWTYPEWLTILRNGAPYFQGYVSDDEPSANGAKEGHTITLSGPWKQLARQTYMQLSAWVTVALDANEEYIGLNQTILAQVLPYPLFAANGQQNILTSEQEAANAAASQNPDSYPHYEALTSIILLYSTLTGDTWDTNEMITAVLTFAISQGVNLQIGTLAAGITVPQEEIKDKSCAEVIKRILSWQQDVIVWFDYTTDPPTFNTTQRANRTAFTLTQGTDLFSVIKIKPLYDLLLSGVTLNYIEPLEWPGYTFYTLAQDQAGPDPTGIGALQATIQLMGGEVVDQAYTEFLNGQPIPQGLAAYLYSVYGTLQFQGTVTVSRDECPAGNGLTLALSIVGLRPEWAGMAATIQSQTDNIFSGLTTYNIGAPTQLTAASLAALASARGNYQPLTPLSASRMTGGTPQPDQTPQQTAPPTAYSGPEGTTDPATPGLPTGPYESYDPSTFVTDIVYWGGSVDIGHGITNAASNGDFPPIPTITPAITSGSGIASSDSYALWTQFYLGAWTNESQRTQSYCVIAFDLVGLAITPGSSVYLVGTKTLSTGTGTSTTPATTTTPVWQTLSGTSGSGITILQGVGAVYVQSSSFEAATGSCSFTEIRVYPPASL